MKNFKLLVKRKPELLGYIVLILLLFLSCFFVEVSFITVVYSFLFAIFLRNEGKILGLILFVYPFYQILNIVNVTIYSSNSVALNKLFYLVEVLFDILKLFIFVLFLQKVIKREKKINFKIFLPLILFLIYVLLPFHNTTWSDWINLVLTYLSLYVIFEERQEICFLYLARLFVTGLVLSCVFGMYHYLSPLLTKYMNFISTHLYLNRYPALTTHPLQLSAFIIIAISSILLLRYKEKISVDYFFLLYIPLLIWGYLTISRIFVIVFLILLIIFTVLYIIKHKKTSFNLLWGIYIILTLVVVFWLDETKCLFIRFSNDYGSQMSPDIPMEDILSGNMAIYLNRTELYKFYFNDWCSSIKTFLLGSGISRRPIGGLNAHNILLQKLWEHGIIGCIFYVVIFIMMINWKKIKEVKKYIPVLIFIIPLIAFLMVETIDFEYIGFALTFVIIGWLGKEEKKEQPTNNMNNEGEKIEDELLKKIRLSIIVPVYNGEKFIKRCIDKILQIKLEKEIIVIDDGSTDNSLELLKEYKEQIILINLKENKGVSHARNLGLEKATGDYISFIDIDDDFELDMHSKIITKMLKENADVGMCRYDQRNGNGHIIKEEKPFCFQDLSQEKTISYYLLDKFICAVWTSVYKSSIVKSIKFEENITIGEDRLYQLRILLKAQKTSFINEILYHYIDNSCSSTHLRSTPKNVMGHIEIPNYLTLNEKNILNDKFSKEFEFFKLWSVCLVINMVSQWYQINKNQKKDVKSFILNLLDKNTFKEIFNNKFIAKQIKLEFFVLKNLGINFHLFVFPFYKFLRKILRFLGWSK